MKRLAFPPLVAFLVLVLATVLSAADPVQAERPFPKPTGLVNDYAEVIPSTYEQQINGITGELLQKTGVPVVVVTMPDIGGAEYNDYANRLYSAWGIGKKGEDKGVLVFITVKERKMRIETGYGVEGILPDGLVGQIRDRHMVPYLKEDRYGEGLLNGAAAVARVIAKDAGVTLTGEGVPPPPRSRGNRSVGRILFFPILILIFLIISFLSRGRRRGGAGLLLLPFIFGGGPRMGGGGFGGFSGGFGGFGGGMSGGGGAGGGF